MDVLVTGGAGFIGSHIAERLLIEGYRVVTLDPLDPFYATGIKEHNVERCREVGGNRFTFVEGSVTDEDRLDDIFAEYAIEFVYHEAAQAGVRKSVEDPKKSHEINTTGLLNVLLAADRHSVERVVNASSSSVYGEAEYLPYDEDHPNYPQSPYAVSKLAGDHYCRVWNGVYDVNTVSLRYFGVYGPRMRPNMAITNFTSRCLNGKPPVIYGDGQQTRDFTYVDDIVDANLRLLETDAADGEVMNVGSTGNITIQELAEYIIDITGADVDIEYDEPREADARHTQADISKANDLIQYEPTTTINEGVAQFVEWYRENRDWYEPLVISS